VWRTAGCGVLRVRFAFQRCHVFLALKNLNGFPRQGLRDPVQALNQRFRWCLMVLGWSLSLVLVKFLLHTV
jgi:hypothetical protein